MGEKDCYNCFHGELNSRLEPCRTCVNHGSECPGWQPKEKIKATNKYEEIAKGIAKLVQEKQIAYGDSFGRSEEMLKILYPDGIKPEQLKDALTVVRVIDKIFRIANKKDAFGESPWRDIMGYSLLSVEREERENDK